MKPAMKTPGVDPWRTSSFADGTALGIVPGHTEQPTLEICAAVFDRSQQRRLVSPDLSNYFGDAQRSSGMVRAVRETEEERREDAVAGFGGRIEVDASGRIKQD